MSITHAGRKLGSAAINTRKARNRKVKRNPMIQLYKQKAIGTAVGIWKHYFNLVKQSENKAVEALKHEKLDDKSRD